MPAMPELSITTSKPSSSPSLRDLLGVPHEDGGRGVDEAAGGDHALGVGELHGDDDVDVLGVEQARRRGGLVLLLDQPGVDDVAVRAQRVGDLLRGGRRGGAHVRGLVVVVLEQGHDEDADLRASHHRVTSYQLARAA